MSIIGTNAGHGHVWARPDGVRARCGGPGLCAACSADAAISRPIPAMTTPDEALIAAELRETMRLQRDRFIAPKGTADRHWLAVERAIEALSRPTVPDSGIAALRDHIEEQITFAETRIKDGIEMGASIWRIALEDIVRENRTALASKGASNGW